MANKAKKKLSIMIPASKPRNPFYEEAKNQRAGAHGPTPKALRQKTRQNMQRDLDELIREDKTEFDID